MAQREMKNAIQMGHFGNLAAIAATIPDGDKTSRVLGYVIGKATGVSYRNNPNGEAPSTGLLGLFEATPTIEGMPVMIAPVIFLPSGFMSAIVPQLVGADNKDIPKKAPPKGKHIDVAATAEIPLALEIGIRKNTGAGVGYEFSVVMLMGDGEKQDALGDLRTFLPANVAKIAAPALPAPSANLTKAQAKKAEKEKASGKK